MPDLRDPPYRQPVQVLIRPDRETFERNHVFPAKPAIIRGAIGHWPAMTKWSLRYFSDAFGHVEVHAYRRGHRDAGLRMTLADYLAYSRQAAERDPLYLSNWAFSEDCPSLLRDYSNPAIFERLENRLPPHLRPRWRWIFLGPAGSGTPLHVDVLHTSAWNAAITGRKRWLFYSPDQVRYLYHGAVDCFAPDLGSFPLFEHAQALECVQEPGDLVFTPSGWWHQVHNELEGISITENFINRANLDNVKLAAQLTNMPHLDEAIKALA